MTKLNAALPKGEANGLEAISRQLVESPHSYHIVVAVIDCKKVTTDNDSGEVEPTARIRRVEPLSGDDAAAVEQIMRRSKDQRLGRPVLDFGVDVETGEVRL